MRKKTRDQMFKQPAPTASAVGPCPIVSQISKTPGTEILSSTIALPDHFDMLAAFLSGFFRNDSSRPVSW